MSIHNTPHMHSKRPPGPAGPEPQAAMGMPQHGSPAPATQPPHVAMNSARCVSDSNVSNPRQLLNAYVYEFLVKSTLPDTARLFALEADIPLVPLGQAQQAPQMSPALMGRADAAATLFDKDPGPASLASATPHTPALSVAQFAEDHNLPGLALRMEAPQGFLLEWWQVFWDVYQAKNDRGPSSAAATQYLHMQMVAQRQGNEPFHSASAPTQPPQTMLAPTAAQPPMANMVPHGVPGPLGPAPQMAVHHQQQQQLQRQLQAQQPPPNMDPRQQRYMMQMMMKQQQFQQQQQQQQKQFQNLQNQPLQLQGQPQLNQPPAQGPPLPPHTNFPHMQQQHIQLQHQQQQTPHQTPQQAPLHTPPHPQHPVPQGMDQPMNNMPMNMKLQQMFIHQQGLTQAQNRIQQQAQTQMNNLRQQAVVSQQHPGQNSTAAAAAAVAAAAAAAANPLPTDGNSPVNINGQRMNQMRTRPMPSQNLAAAQVPFQGNMVNGAAMSSSFVTGNAPGPGHNMPMGNAPMANNGPSGQNSNALQDYQMQLMMLERQNKKRLDIARSNGTSESPGPMQQVQQPVQMMPHQQIKAQARPSPRMQSQVSPGAGGTKTKKEPASKRKQNAPTSATTPQSAGTDVNGVVNGRGAAGGQVKRERPTPTTESEGAKKKKKLDNGDSPKKAAKHAPGAKKEKSTPKVKHAEEPTLDTVNLDMADGKTYDHFSTSKVPPSNSALFQPTLGSVEIIGGAAGPAGNNDVNFFNAGVNSGIDDMDFDFNLFLDGGDEGLNDRLSTFSWGNPIEGD